MNKNRKSTDSCIWYAPIVCTYRLLLTLLRSEHNSKNSPQSADKIVMLLQPIQTSMVCQLHLHPPAPSTSRLLSLLQEDILRIVLASTLFLGILPRACLSLPQAAEALRQPYVLNLAVWDL